MGTGVMWGIQRGSQAAGQARKTLEMHTDARTALDQSIQLVWALLWSVPTVQQENLALASAQIDTGPWRAWLSCSNKHLTVSMSSAAVCPIFDRAAWQAHHQDLQRQLK